jgi:CYTH domain-containing protein
MEIERKFLVDEVPPGIPDTAWTQLRQGYLAAGPDGEVRLRDAGGTLTLTVKSGAGIVREEGEIALAPAQFEALWLLTQERRVAKRRARLEVSGHRCELDVFAGALLGLIVAEVEFGTLEEALAYQPPAWFGTEVTDDARYTNASLADAGLPERPEERAR